MDVFQIGVTGSSMGPHLPSQVRIIERPPRVGDVVLFRDGSRFVLHRCLWIFGRGSSQRLLLQGDASSSADPLVAAERVLGVASLPARPFWARSRGLMAIARRVFLCQ